MFLSKIRVEKPEFVDLSDEEVLTLCGLYEDGRPTLAGLMLFGWYPQANYLGFGITAVVVPGYSMGSIAEDGARFLDNKRLEGTIPELLDGAMNFVMRNVKIRTIIDESGKKHDMPEYPLRAVREIILNALIHPTTKWNLQDCPLLYLSLLGVCSALRFTMNQSIQE